MKQLPEGLRPYKRTPTFTGETVPSALLRDHATKAGVWGLIHVMRGEIVYRTAASREEHRLTRGCLGVVEPKALHSVELVGDTAFFVEFWKAKNA